MFDVSEKHNRMMVITCTVHETFVYIVQGVNDSAYRSYNFQFLQIIQFDSIPGRKTACVDYYTKEIVLFNVNKLQDKQHSKDMHENFKNSNGEACCIN